MYAKVKIGNEEIPMMAMASTDHYFKNTFGEDPMKKMTDPNLEVSEMVDVVMKLGFIMTKFAQLKKRKEMLKLNEDAYYEWLDRFQREDLVNDDVLVAIQDVYQGNNETTSEAKNQADQ